MNYEKLFSMEEDAVKMRGIILGGTIEVERLIDQYLAKYFCPTFEKVNELMELLLCTDRVALDAKRQIFVVILKKHNTDFLLKNPTFLKRLDDLIPHRNIFAHAELMTNHENVEQHKEKISFKRYANGKVITREYTQKVILALEKDMLFLQRKIIMLLQEMPPIMLS
jgi:hypothetical protein